MLQIATKSTWTHVGVLLIRGGKPYVLEASAKVTLTPLNQFIAKSRGNQVSVKRFAAAGTEDLSRASVQQKLELASKPFLGKPYDIRFEWGNDKIYCSELVQKVFERAFNVEVGPVQKFSEVLGVSRTDPDWGQKLDPVVRQTIEKRYGSTANIDLDAPVVTPAAQYQSSKLRTIYECAEAVSPAPVKMNPSE